jgi:hypothetical protein
MNPAQTSLTAHPCSIHRYTNITHIHRNTHITHIHRYTNHSHTQIHTHHSLHTHAAYTDAWEVEKWLASIHPGDQLHAHLKMVDTHLSRYTAALCTAALYNNALFRGCSIHSCSIQGLLYSGAALYTAALFRGCPVHSCSIQGLLCTQLLYSGAALYTAALKHDVKSNTLPLAHLRN